MANSDQWDQKGFSIALELERTIGFDRHHEWPGIIADALRAAYAAGAAVRTDPVRVDDTRLGAALDRARSP